MSFDDELRKIDLENMAAEPGMEKVGGMLALVVEDALWPALEGRRVSSCLHILDEITKRRALPLDTRVEVDQQALICPMHPGRLLCNMPECLGKHVETRHADDGYTARCFVCETRMLDELTGELRDDFEGVNAQVQLHQQVPFYDDNRGRDRWYMYAGDLWTLPVAWLCPRHSGLLELPVRMAWPTTLK